MLGCVRRVAASAREAQDRDVPSVVVVGPIEGVSAGRIVDVILPQLLVTKQPLRVEIRGATHAAEGPAYPLLRYALQPALGRLGFDVGFELTRGDFGASPDGRLYVHARPPTKLVPHTWGHPGRFVSLRCEILIARWPIKAAQEQLKVLRHHLHSAGWPLPAVTVREADEAKVAGNAVTVRAICTDGEAVFTATASEGDEPATVASAAAKRAMGWLTSGVAIQRRLARRLVVPMALAGGGRFVCDGRDDPHLATLAEAVGGLEGVTCRLVRHRDRLVVEVNHAGKLPSAPSSS